MKRLFLLAGLFLVACVADAAAFKSYTASWNAPMTAIDGSPIVGALTYQVYVGTVSHSTKAPYGTPVASLSEVIVPSAVGLMCITVTAIAGGLESVPSNEACVTVPAAVPIKPNPPVTVTLQ